MSMAYVYGAMLLHHAGKPVDAGHLAPVLQEAGLTVDPNLLDALLDSMKGLDLKSVVAKVDAERATVAQPAPASVATPSTAPPAEEKKTEDDAATGLDKLFGN